MSDPWGAATRGFGSTFDTAVQLGARSVENTKREQERKAVRGIAETQRKEDVAYRSRGREITEAKEKREQTAFDAKNTAKIANNYMSIARAQSSNDNNFAAAKTIMNMYSEIPNGDEVVIMQREYDKTDAFKEFPENVNVFIKSKKYGESSYKNMREAIKAISGLTNATDIAASMRDNDMKLAQANATAAENPWQADDGEQYVTTYKFGPGGVIVKGEEVPFTGRKRATKLEVELGTKPTQKQKEIKAGLREKEKQPTSATAGKEIANNKKRLDFILRQFVGSLKSTWDAEGNETKEGKNGLVEAQKVIAAGKTDTQADRKLLDDAREAVALYEEIRKGITKGVRVKPSGKKRPLSDYQTR